MGGALSVYGIRTPFFVASGVAALGLMVTLVFMANTIPPKRPPNSGTSEALTTQNKLSLLLNFIYALPYTAEITLCGQYLLLRFGMASNDVGNFVALHGLVATLNSLFVFPFVLKRVGLYWTWSLGCAMMGIGLGICGLGEVWYMFLLLMSPLAGGGFGLALNANNPLVDSWTSPYTKAKVMGMSAAVFNLTMAIGPMIWGLWLDYCVTHDHIQYFFLLPGICCVIPLVIMALAYHCSFKTAILQRADKQRLLLAREKEHEICWTDCEPTKDDTDRLGAEVGALLARKHYNWPDHTDYVVSTVDSFFPSLPIRSVEVHMKAYGWLSRRSAQHKEEWETFACAEDMLESGDSKLSNILNIAITV